MNIINKIKDRVENKSSRLSKREVVTKAKNLREFAYLFSHSAMKNKEEKSSFTFVWNENERRFFILDKYVILNYRVATAVLYIFFCALVEEKVYTKRKRRGGEFELLENIKEAFYEYRRIF